MFHTDTTTTDDTTDAIVPLHIARAGLARMHDDEARSTALARPAALARDPLGELTTRGLVFPLAIEQLYGPDGLAYPTVRGIKRTDTNAPLGHVGPAYTPISGETIATAVRELVGPLAALGDGGAIARHFQWANGARFSFEVTLPAALQALISPDQSRTARLLVRGSHDGSSSLRATLLVVRGACLNVLGIGHGERTRTGRTKDDAALKTLSVRHTKGGVTWGAHLNPWFRDLGAEIKARGEAFQRMAREPITPAVAAALVGEILDADPAEYTRAQKARAETIVDMAMAADGVFVPGGAPTRLHLLEAVTAYDTHRVGVRQPNADAEVARRYERIIDGDALGARAYDVLRRAA